MNKKNKIFGIGLGRTGTSSLGTACKMLGYTLKENDFKLTKKVREGDIQSALKVAKRYDCMEDFPWCLVYKELDEKFPNSKFILTVRKNSKTWIKSYIYQSIRGRLEVRKEYPRIYSYEYLSEYPIGNEDEWLKIYKNHNKDVRKYFKDNPNFIELCWEKGHGWKELCDFIDEPMPSISFPHRKWASYVYYDEVYEIAKKNPRRYFGLE